jgi:hypothetical protein
MPEVRAFNEPSLHPFRLAVARAEIRAFGGTHPSTLSI